jgi:hypothetical protein
MAPHKTLAMTALAIAAVSIAVVLVLVLRFGAELARVSGGSASIAAESAEETPAVSADATLDVAVPLAADGSPAAASCSSSDSAAPPPARPSRTFAIARSPTRERLLVSRDAGASRRRGDDDAQ